ncbi:MAG: hypothetical protein DSY80_03860, partial [Desulfocapsa sp.]
SSAYCGNGPEKLARAERLFLQSGRMLLARNGIRNTLVSLQEAVKNLDAHMLTMEMGKNCGVCAALPGGGCCSAYMGHENNDVLQLLMNMLAGVAVSCVRDDEVDCCFLAENGCILSFKPIFCLNYLCERIQKESTVAALAVLEERTGRLLRIQVELEGLIISALQSS